MIGIKSPRNCFPLSLIVVDAKTDLQTKASNGHSQGLSHCMIDFEPVSPLRASSANKHGEKKYTLRKKRKKENCVVGSSRVGDNGARRPTCVDWSVSAAKRDVWANTY